MNKFFILTLIIYILIQTIDKQYFIEKEPITITRNLRTNVEAATANEEAIVEQEHIITFKLIFHLHFHVQLYNWPLL